MVANPLYGPYPDVDVEQLRALRRFPSGEWRGPGCGDRCVRVYAEIMGGGGREVIEAHDPKAHEAYVHALYVPRIVRTGCLTVDINARRYWVEDREVSQYPPISWVVLRALACRLGAVVSTDELWVALHGPLVPKRHGPSYFSTVIYYTRQSLGPAARLIETRVDLGYMLRAEEP